MENISYVRAGASCLPLIGFFIGALYNAFEFKKEKSSSPWNHLLGWQRTDLIGLKVSVFAATGNKAGLYLVKPMLETECNELQNKQLLAAKKNRIYTISEIVGNVLSVALLVSLTTIGTLNAQSPLIFGGIAAYTAQAVVLSNKLDQHNKLSLSSGCF